MLQFIVPDEFFNDQRFQIKDFLLILLNLLLLLFTMGMQYQLSFRRISHLSVNVYAPKLSVKNLFIPQWVINILTSCYPPWFIPHSSQIFNYFLEILRSMLTHTFFKLCLSVCIYLQTPERKTNKTINNYWMRFLWYPE